MKLSTKLHISEVEALCSQLTELLDSAQPVYIDVSEVEAIDTASVQALCSLQKSLSMTGNAINWVGNSQVLVNATEKLGVAQFLNVTE
ncbi:MAG: STAS domain-containing protein [Gammaproteobacteria bacterium]|nr:STAS domain-containing protein [Gammaproteobacteria bacterium]